MTQLNLSLLLLGSSIDSLIDLLNRLGDADSDGLSHVSDSESTNWVLVVTLRQYGRSWDELDNHSIYSLEELGVKGMKEYLDGSILETSHR
jgi:hypothetical protein